MRRSNALVYAIGTLGMMAATAAFAVDESAKPAAASKATAAASQPQICRTRLRPGSHIATRTCLTAAQWAARNQQVGVHDGTGPWGQVSTAAQSVGMSAFTAR
jgi:hypothetical protein